MKSFLQFTANPSITYAYDAARVLNRDVYRVMEGFKFYIGKKEDDKYVFVPKGYLVDGASVPRFLWASIPPWGSYGPATIVHDYLCEYLFITEKGSQVKITRKEADQIFFEAMEVLEVKAWTQFKIKLGINSYRILFNVREANLDRDKAAIENMWLADNGLLYPNSEIIA